MAQSPLTPVVEPARQVTTDPTPDRLYQSPDIAVHPDDPDTVVIATGDARKGGCGLHLSRDGGLTFAPAGGSFMPPQLPFCFQLNFGPAIEMAFDPDGQLYIATAGSSPATGHPLGPVDAITVRTSDLGKTSEVFTVEKAREVPYTTASGAQLMGTSSLGNNTIAVDTNDPDRIYRGFRFRTRGVNGQSSGQADRPRLAVSGDGGRTWGPSIDPLEQFGAEVYGGDLPMLATGPGGVVYGFTRERLRAAPAGQPPNVRQKVFMTKSTDGGRNWVSSVAFDDARGLGDPGVAVDPRNGNVYVVFESGAENGTEHAYFMASSDGGATWSKPVNIVDSGGAGHNQSVPGISVSPDGRIDVAWYDFRNDPFFTPGGTVTQRWLDVYGASSTDEGRTWSANYRVSDRSIDSKLGATFDNEDVRGPLGVASTKHAALVTWADSRAGAAPEFDVEDVYFTRVRFGSPDIPPGTDFDLTSAVLGGGAALALAGLVFLGATRAGRRRRSETLSPR
ncbi:MAG: sialidase family protein [Acidimicrobiales bacterium]